MAYVRRNHCSLELLRAITGHHMTLSWGLEHNVVCGQPKKYANRAQLVYAFVNHSDSHANQYFEDDTEVTCLRCKHFMMLAQDPVRRDWLLERGLI